MPDARVLVIALVALVALGAVTALLRAAAAGRRRATPGDAVEREASLASRRARQSLVVGLLPPRPTTFAPADEHTIGITRRRFFNRSIVALAGVGLAGAGGAVLAFLWPKQGGGFGSKITVGMLDDVLGSIADVREPFYVPEGRFYLNPYPAEFVDKAGDVYSPSVLPGMEAGVVALYQKCTHLGCRVPWCTTSQWFECPCHGSQYNRVGERRGGPAPRGLDRFPVEVDARGMVTVNTGAMIQGPPVGTDTTGQQAEGPHCIGAGAEH